MSKGHPYRYDQGGPYDRHRSRYGQHDTRRDLGSPYKKQRKLSSSGNDFTTFSYEDCHQDVGLGNFNDFSAINRETILPRDRRRDNKTPSSQSDLSVQTSRSNVGNKPTSKTSPLSVNISPTSSHSCSKPLSSSTSGSLLSSFKQSDSQPASPYKPATTSTLQYGAQTESNQSTGHNIPSSYHVNQSNPGTGLLMQAKPADVNTTYAANTAVTSVKEDVYQPKVEAVSPTNSETEAEKANAEFSKEADNKNRTNELLKQMEKVDKEIADVEKKINDLREKEKILEDELSQDAMQEEEEEKESESVKQENGIEEENKVEVIPPEPKEKTLIEKIYEENRQKAAAAHERFARIGIPLPTALPLYNQPSDLPFYEENRKNARAVQLKLVKYFQRKRKDKQIKQRALMEQYRVLHKKWMEKVEKIENNPKRKSKESRVRDFYEKIFPEIRRHREQAERFSRIGSRANWGMSARSDAEYEEILRDLEDKERHEKHMRQLAVNIPPLFDENQRRVKYINRNGLIKDLKTYVEQRKMLNVWTEDEKETFKEKYIEAPKDFEYIARFLSNKSVKDCVLYYYRTKRTGNYKKLAKKQTLKRKRMSTPTVKDETSKSKILKPRPEGYRSESDIEDEEPFDVDSDGSEGSSSRIPISTSVTCNPPTKMTTLPNGSKVEAASVETPRWSKNEREIAIEGLRLHGRSWTAISQMVKTKTEAQCKNFYFNYKRKLDLENIVAEHNASKVIQRQESEETISASEASDDNYDIPEERPSIVRSKQNVRETRSQTAERRTESGPTLRNSRSQRQTRQRSAEGKPSRGQLEELSNTKVNEVDNIVPAGSLNNAGSDETPIVVVDTEEPQGDEEIARSTIGPREVIRAQLSPMESCVRVAVSDVVNTTTAHSGVLATSSQTVAKTTSTSSSREPNQMSSKSDTQNSSCTPKVEHTSANESQKITVNTPSSVVYPTNIPYRPMETTAIAGIHSEALLNLVRKNAAENAGRVENPTEEPGEKNEKEKLKKNRFPDPQLPKFEQNEAIGIFNRYSPCIPPDTTSRQQVRTQRHPHPPFHPLGIPMPPFVPHISHGNPHFPPEMFAIPIHHGPGFEHMFPPHLVEYYHPGMEHNLFSARLREEAARASTGPVMWSPMEHPGIMLTPPFIIPVDPLTPTDRLPRRRESGHEIISPVSSSRCRSVESPAIPARSHTPDQIISSSKPSSQQRSSSLNDVHSWSTSSSSERRSSPAQTSSKPSTKDSDPVKHFEHLDILANAAVRETPMVEKVGELKRESVKITENERTQAQFTRQSCVVTNTSVLHVSSSPKDSSGSQAHGISSGLAPQRPPPLLSITGTQAPRSEGVTNPRIVQTQTIGRSGSRDMQDSAGVVNTREIVHARDTTVTRSVTPVFVHSSREQPPPPLVRDISPVDLRRTPPGLVGRSNQELPCGCKSTELCKHELYSHEVPYVQRLDARNVREVVPPGENTPLPSREVKTLFRPWAEQSPSQLKTVSPPVQLKQTNSSLQAQQPQKRQSPLRGGLRTTPPPSVIPDPFSQQPAVLISHPTSERLVDNGSRPETHPRSSHPSNDPFSVLKEPRPRQSNVVPHDVILKPSLTPQGPTTHLKSSNHHLQRPPDSSSVLHPPQLFPTRSRSPVGRKSTIVPTSSQPSDLPTSRNIREPSVIKSPHPPPLLSTIHPSTSQPAQPAHPSSSILKMSYAVSHPPHSSSTQTIIQDPRGPSTVIKGRDPQFPATVASQHALIHPSLIENTSLAAPSGARLPFEQSWSSSEHSRVLSEHLRALSRTYFPSLQSCSASKLSISSSEQSRCPPESSRCPTESSRVLTESSRVLTESSRVPTDYPSPIVSKSITSRSMSASPGPKVLEQDLKRSTDSKKSLKSLFIDQVELQETTFDDPVDIRRHENPSYAGKTVSNSASCDDVTLSSSTVNTNNQDNESLPPSTSADTIGEERATTPPNTKDEEPHPNRSPLQSDMDCYPPEETYESREDSRSFTGSSVGFESPDDEDHELRMRYFPPQLDSDIHDSGDEFSNTDATYIQSDSTYIDVSESADENVGIRNVEHGSSADVVDNGTLSESSEFEKPLGKDGRKENESRTDMNIIDTEFYESETPHSVKECMVSDNSDTDEPSGSEELGIEESLKVAEGVSDRTEKNIFSGNSRHCSDSRHFEEMSRLQDDTISGHEGDDDTTEDETRYSRIEMDSKPGTRMDKKGKVMDTRTRKVDICKGAKVVDDKFDSGAVEDSSDDIVAADDGTIEDNVEQDRLSTDSKGEVDTVESEGKTPSDSVKDDEGNTLQEGVFVDTHDVTVCEEARELKDNIGLNVDEDKELNMGERSSGQMRKEAEELHASDEISPHSANKTEKDSTTEKENKTRDEVKETVSNDTQNDTEISVQSLHGNEDDVTDIENAQPLMSIENDSQNVKEVSSTSDPCTGKGSHNVNHRSSSDPSTADDGNRDVDRVAVSENISDSHDVRENNTRDFQVSFEAGDGVDSSTDSENITSGDKHKITSHLVEENPHIDSCADREDIETLNKSEGRVTSSNEHVEEEEDEHVIEQDTYMAGEAENVTSLDEHVTVQDQHVSGRSELSDGEENKGQMDRQTSEEHNEMKEGNEMENKEMEVKEGGSGVEPSTLGSFEIHKAIEDDDKILEEFDRSSMIESTSNTNQHTNENNSLMEATFLKQDIEERHYVSTTGCNINNNHENTLEELSNTNQGNGTEHSTVETNHDITSTVKERQKNITSQHIDSQISSTFDTGTRQHKLSPDNGSEMRGSYVSTSSCVAMQRDDVASSSVAMEADAVASSSVTMQQDDVTTVNDPNISDVSSSESSAEDANEAKSRTSSFEVDLPDSAHTPERRPSGSSHLENQNSPSHSRRSSEDSTGHSDEPSTTNYDVSTVFDGVTDSHDNISGNEAESSTVYEEDVVSRERNSGGHAMIPKDNIVDSSTVSPVSFTDENSHPDTSIVDIRDNFGSNKDLIGSSCGNAVDTTDNVAVEKDNKANTSEGTVDTTGYLGFSGDPSTTEDVVDTMGCLSVNRDNPASTNETKIDTTGYFGMNMDDSGCLNTCEDTVGTTMGITSSSKYGITVEAISSDEELEEGEIAETPDNAPVHDVTPGDVTPEHMITSSSGSYFPPLDTIPISPPADSDEPSSSFLEFRTYTYSPTQHAGSSTQPAGSSRVFPYSALNVRSAPNSNCSSPVPVGFGSGCNTPIRYQQADSTPIRFQPADSSNLMTPQYEPLSDDESSESHDTPE